MIATYAVRENQLLEVLPPEQPKWVNLVAPTHTEIQQLEHDYQVPLEFIMAALDPDEVPRMEEEEDVMLFVVRVPLINDDENEGVPYVTRPLGIILTPSAVITVSGRETTVVADFVSRKIKNYDPAQRLQFLLRLLHRSAIKYHRYLRDIDRRIHEVENLFRHSQENTTLVSLLSLEKSLLFFTTSLRANQNLMMRMKRTPMFRVADEDIQEELDDVLVDNNQAIEMAYIYTNILSSLMGTFATMVSNNLSRVMKTLTKITVVLMLPTLVASFMGMNVALPFQSSAWAFGIITGVCVLIGGGAMWVMNSRKFN